jgi:hypothetical protein
VPGAGVDAAVVARWVEAAETAYLDAYRAALAGHGLAELLDERLLRPARLQQECREFRYAARHRPHWRYVPDAALGALVDGNPAGRGSTLRGSGVRDGTDQGGTVRGRHSPSVPVGNER